MSQPTKIETENLEAHVSICQERYEALEGKIDRLEHRLGDLEVLVRDISDKLSKMEQRQTGYWFTIAGGTVITLLGVIAWFFVRYIA